MVSRRKEEPTSQTSSRRPATTPEARENQLIAYAEDLAAKQLQEGTASAQVITHYLKLGSSREKLEQERLRQEVGLLQIKAETIASQQRIEELYVEAIAAMRSYAGHAPEPSGDDYDEYED
jgi:hypothetical protein